MPESIDWPKRSPRRRRFLLLLVLAAIIIFGSRTAFSYYVDALWFGSLGYGEVFRKTLSLEWALFAAFSAATFLVLYGWFLTLRRAYQPDLLGGRVIFVGGQPLKLPTERILRLIVLLVSLRHRGGNRRRHDGGVADLRALLVCAAHRRRSCRSHLRQSHCTSIYSPSPPGS